MVKNLLRSSLVILGVSIFSSLASAESGLSQVALITHCDGTQVVRTSPGNFETHIVEANLPGCFNGVNALGSSGASQTSQVSVTVSADQIVATKIVTNCSGLRVTTHSDGTYASTRVEENLPGCIRVDNINDPLPTPKIDLSHGPLLDLASTDIVNYRTKLLKDKGIRFANAVRSARMRREANMQATTAAYLMKNDAVVITGKDTGWVKVQGAELQVTDKKENIVTPNTTRKAKGYTAAKYLRDPNASDLVRIEQADHAYWSDIAHTKVARYVNVRLHPNHESKIVMTLPNNYPLYIVSTVDNWSLVRTDDGSIQGYIRSDYLSIEKAQRVDTSRGVR